jgi:hypothetical protein
MPRGFVPGQSFFSSLLELSLPELGDEGRGAAGGGGV